MSFLDETGYRHLYQKIVNKVQALWQKVGTATLTTNAKNTSEAINELKGTLTNTTLKYTGTATSQGLVVTDIDFTNKIKVVYAENWTAGGIKLYCLIRPSLTNKVVAMPVTDNFSKGASDGDTVDIYVSFNGY